MTTRSPHGSGSAAAPTGLATASSAPSLRALARAGTLSTTAAGAAARNDLVRQAYAVVMPVVFGNHTRRLETVKGHLDCASAVRRLRPSCHDAYLDDVGAVVDHLLDSAHQPIANLEGWITSRIRAATVDAHRRARGARGALQRPRVPGWLATGLGQDPWLIVLAEHILEWVGIDCTAGSEIWPLDAWAGLRRTVRGNDAGPRTVADEVETVLETMRSQRPRWFERYVERPLGRKQAPVLAAHHDCDPVGSPQPLELTMPEERDELLLAELAGLALDAIGARLAAGVDPRAAVPTVLERVFGEMVGAVEERLPCIPDARLVDKSLVAVVLTILAEQSLLRPPLLDQPLQPGA